MAVSITQDGPPPIFFLEWMYDFVSTGEIKSDVRDAELLELIDKVL